MKMALYAALAAMLMVGTAGVTDLEAKTCKAKRVMGAGKKYKSRKAAKLSSRIAWRKATRGKYGGKWANWSKAKMRSNLCSKIFGKYSCRARAYPCK